jgi:hypothetical protein
MHHGTNLAELLAHARDLGIEVNHLRRTGEIQLSHPSQPKRPRLNGRRKDAPRCASSFVNRVEAAMRCGSGRRS